MFVLYEEAKSIDVVGLSSSVLPISRVCYTLFTDVLTKPADLAIGPHNRDSVNRALAPALYLISGLLMKSQIYACVIDFCSGS